MNFDAGQTIANATVMTGDPDSTTLDPGSAYRNFANGNIHLIADLAGYFNW